MSEAWAAGFFDGEGCFKGGRQVDGHDYVGASISQKDRTVLDKFKTIVGVGRIYGPYIRERGPIFIWSISSKAEVRALAIKLWKYLGSEKRKAFLNIAHLTNYKPRNNQYTVINGRKWGV